MIMEFIEQSTTPDPQAMKILDAFCEVANAAAALFDNAIPVAETMTRLQRALARLDEIRDAAKQSLQ